MKMKMINLKTLIFSVVLGNMTSDKSLSHKKIDLEINREKII